MRRNRAVMEHRRGFLIYGIWSAANPMQNLADIRNTAPHDDVQPDVTVEVVLENDSRFDPLWDAMNHNNAEHVAPKLQEIAGDLMLFALNGYNGLIETFDENTGEAVKATRAAIALCRESLDEIEATAAEVAREKIEYHERELDALKAVYTS